mmetsp:Transcript_29525/g.90902  ORF Transcript_29525/g.90902 Transcript_29525/m.90902 type:complete len:293 (+) Transcript_29525:185-1063(+)
MPMAPRATLSVVPSQHDMVPQFVAGTRNNHEKLCSKLPRAFTAALLPPRPCDGGITVGLWTSGQPGPKQMRVQQGRQGGVVQGGRPRPCGDGRAGRGRAAPRAEFGLLAGAGGPGIGGPRPGQGQQQPGAVAPGRCLGQPPPALGAAARVWPGAAADGAGGRALQRPGLWPGKSTSPCREASLPSPQPRPRGRPRASRGQIPSRCCTCPLGPSGTRPPRSGRVPRSRPRASPWRALGGGSSCAWPSAPPSRTLLRLRPPSGRRTRTTPRGSGRWRSAGPMPGASRTWRLWRR